MNSFSLRLASSSLKSSPIGRLALSLAAASLTALGMMALPTPTAAQVVITIETGSPYPRYPYYYSYPHYPNVPGRVTYVDPGIAAAAGVPVTGVPSTYYRSQPRYPYPYRNQPNYRLTLSPSNGVTIVNSVLVNPTLVSPAIVNPRVVHPRGIRTRTTIRF